MAVIIIIFSVFLLVLIVALANTDTSGKNAPRTIQPTPTFTPTKPHTKAQCDTPKTRRLDVKRVMQIADIGSELYDKATNAFFEGRASIAVDEETYTQLNKEWHDYKERQLALAKTSALNEQGRILEKGNQIEDAIKTYEKAIALRYPATHAYDRLMILYRRIGAYEQEQRVINLAVEVFSEVNKRNAEKAKLHNPEYADQIDLALESNESIKGTDGKWIFVQYDVLKYFDRYAKSKALLDRARGTS